MFIICTRAKDHAIVAINTARISALFQPTGDEAIYPSTKTSIFVPDCSVEVEEEITDIVYAIEKRISDVEEAAANRDREEKIKNGQIKVV